MKNTYEEMLAIERESAKIANARTYRSFDAYVKDYPEGESHRNWITNFGKLASDGLLIFTGDGTHSGITGGFLWATLSKRWERKDNKYVPTSDWYVHVHDCDDGLIFKEFPTKELALASMDEIEGYTPISFHEIVTILGYTYH